MTDQDLKQVFYSVMLLGVKDEQFINLFAASFPEFKELVAIKNLEDVPWRMEYLKKLRDNNPTYFTWFKDFISKDTRFDTSILSYSEEIKRKLAGQPSVAQAPLKPLPPAGEIMEKQGPGLWNKLHRYAVTWNGNKAQAYDFFQKFDVLIPCGSCKNHWRELWKETPADLTNRVTLFDWTVAAHNKVNERLGKPIYSLYNAYRDYKFELAGTFDQVYVINLPRRKDRLDLFEQEMERINWPFMKPTVFQGTDGSRVPTPLGWASGNGAYGCMQSHRHVLEHALTFGYKKILVLEDDVIFQNNFTEQVEAFLLNVPEDWEQLMIGGQLFNSSTSEKITPEVRQVTNCQRTHCYAIQGKFIGELYQKWCSSYGHCDHVMGPFQVGHKVYAPTEFLAGQRTSRSDINGKLNPTQFWTDISEEEVKAIDPAINSIAKDKIYYVPGGLEEAKAYINNPKYHSGYNLVDFIDIGLAAILDKQSLTTEQVVSRLRAWLTMILWEARGKQPTAACLIWHPKLTEELLRAAIPGEQELVILK